MTIKDGPDASGIPTGGPLPFSGYDALSPAELRQRVLTVDEDGVYALLMYERRHADRAAMVEVLQRRLASLRARPAELSLSRRRRLFRRRARR